MRTLNHLFENNRSWADSVKSDNPAFFEALSKQQSPSYLWIGCSDSRVPANQIVGLMPGDLFVHRNVANIVVHTDINCLSVIQYAVDVLHVEHIIVCGHYGCGGIAAALKKERLGLIDHWLRHVKEIYEKHQNQLTGIKDSQRLCDVLCELNVIEQVANVCQTNIVQDAWRRNQELAVHGWVYGLHDGYLRDMDICVTKEEELSPIYGTAISRATGQ